MSRSAGAKTLKLIIPSRCRSSAGNTTAETQEDDRTYQQWNLYVFLASLVCRC